MDTIQAVLFVTGFLVLFVSLLSVVATLRASPGRRTDLPASAEPYELVETSQSSESAAPHDATRDAL